MDELDEVTSELAGEAPPDRARFASWGDFLATVRGQLMKVFEDPELLAEFEADRLGLLIRTSGIGILRMGEDPDEPGGQYL